MFFHATGHPSLPRKPNLKFEDVIERQNFKSFEKCKVLNWQRYLGSKVVEQLPRHPKVKGSPTRGKMAKYSRHQPKSGKRFRLRSNVE